MALAVTPRGPLAPRGGRLEKLAEMVLEAHEQDHKGVARWCDVRACREAWEVML